MAHHNALSLHITVSVATRYITMYQPFAHDVILFTTSIQYVMMQANIEFINIFALT